MSMRMVLRRAGAVAILGLLATVVTSEARADFSLAFDTNGSHFGAGTSKTFTDTDDIGGTLTVTFNPNSVSTTAAEGSIVSLGSFTVSTTGMFGFTGLLNKSFTLQIAQTAPVAGGAELPASLQGMLVFSMGNLFIDFGTSNSISVAVPTSPPNVTYSLQNLVGFLDRGRLDLGSSGTTELTAKVNSSGISPIPEPSTMALVLIGLGTAGLTRLRRQRDRKVAL